MLTTKPAYLVIGRRNNGQAVIKKATQSWPMLEAGEVVVRVSLDLPDSVFEHPIVTIEVDATEAATAVTETIEDQHPAPETILYPDPDRASETGGGVGA